VTRVQQFAESLGPASIMLGSDDENRVYLQDQHATWHNELRGPLRTYANLHPSEEVRKYGREVESAVSTDLSATIYLLSMRNSQEAHNAYLESDRAHKAAAAQSEALMKCDQAVLDDQMRHLLGGPSVRRREQMSVGAKHRLRAIAEPCSDDVQGTPLVSAMVACVCRRTCSVPAKSPAAFPVDAEPLRETLRVDRLAELVCEQEVMIDVSLAGECTLEKLLLAGP
jgi:hypothetical protein